MKKIELIPEAPFHNYVEVAVMDFPAGEDGPARRRCGVTVEFSEYDVEQLKAQGLSFEGAMAYYKEWLYNVVKAHIAQDWECVGGCDEVMSIVEERVSAYY